MPIPDQIQNFYLGLLFESPFVEVITAEKMHLSWKPDELEIFEIQRNWWNLVYAPKIKISFSRFSQKLSTLGHMLLHKSYINATIAVILS